MLDVTLALIQRIDFCLVNVQAQHGHARSGELQRQGQTDVTETDDGNFHSDGGATRNWNYLGKVSHTSSVRENSKSRRIILR